MALVSLGEIIKLIEMGVKLPSLLAGISARRVDRFISPSPDARKLPSLYRFLRNVYYDLPVLAGPDGFFPVGVLPVSEQAKSTIDRLSVSLNSAPSSFRVMHPEIVKALERSGVRPWNGRTFSLSGLVLDPSGAVDGLVGYLGSYFAMLSSADYLEYELLAAILRRDTSITIACLRERESALGGFASPRDCLVSGGGIDAAIAVSTLVVYAREKRYWMLCDVRSTQVAEYGNLRPLNLNDEFLANESRSDKPHLESVTTLPIDSPRWSDVVKPWQMVPPAAPALVLGAKRAAEILKIAEPAWLCQYHVVPPLEKP